MTAHHLESARGYCDLEDLQNQFDGKKKVIRERLKEFKTIGGGSDEEVFAELCFCLLTPQSKARACDKAIKDLIATSLLFTGSPAEIARTLRSTGVRFHNGKARWIVAAREEFLHEGRWSLKKRLDRFEDAFEAREWLVDNITGLGYKEAGHFLRNIGKGYDLAILDRHIMRNLHRHGALAMTPKSLSKKEYVRIEGLMKEFSGHVGISLAELDLLFWSRETGEVFK